VSTANVQVVRWGAEQARIGPWQGDDRVAFLSPLAGTAPPSVAFVRRCLDQLAGHGFSRVVTGALAAPEQAAFIGAGFRVEESLHVLGADVSQVIDGSSGHARPDVVIRRTHSADRPHVLALDHLAFDPFWQMDDAGLLDALRATPRARFRVAVGARPDPTVATGIVGYAITGRAGGHGFLQRLAVHPTWQRRGVGRALVLDGLAWLHRRGVDHAAVNTQLENRKALALYESLGFRRERRGLSVLSAGVRP
jgi:ribosomal protein S18 acetylase RimI-like enzyme